jgi:hypothetical protein
VVIGSTRRTEIGGSVASELNPRSDSMKYFACCEWASRSLGKYKTGAAGWMVSYEESQLSALVICFPIVKPNLLPASSIRKAGLFRK